MRDRARAVVIGGGVGGCSIAYWLARLGWNDEMRNVLDQAKAAVDGGADDRRAGGAADHEGRALPAHGLAAPLLLGRDPHLGPEDNENGPSRPANQPGDPDGSGLEGGVEHPPRLLRRRSELGGLAGEIHLNQNVGGRLLLNGGGVEPPQQLHRID